MNITEMLEKLPSEAKKIVVEFSGSGDDGGINEITILDEKDMIVSRMPVFGQEKFQPVPEGLEDAVYEFLEEKADWDWVNNDGGGGTLEINIPGRKFKLSGYYNETVQRDVAGEKGAL